MLRSCMYHSCIRREAWCYGHPAGVPFQHEAKCNHCTGLALVTSITHVPLMQGRREIYMSEWSLRGVLWTGFLRTCTKKRMIIWSYTPPYISTHNMSPGNTHLSYVLCHITHTWLTTALAKKTARIPPLRHTHVLPLYMCTFTPNPASVFLLSFYWRKRITRYYLFKPSHCVRGCAAPPLHISRVGPNCTRDFHTPSTLCTT